MRQPLKGKNLQARVSGQIRMGQKLALQLKSGLFWREQNQRKPQGIISEGLADFLQAQERFSRAGGAKQKSHMHTAFVAQKKRIVKEEGARIPCRFDRGRCGHKKPLASCRVKCQYCPRRTNKPAMKKLLLILGLLVPALGHAQSYSIDWFKVAGGGGTSTGTNGATVYSVSGTVGQQDAGTAMTGGNYSLTGGFWSLIALVQTPGAPFLTITQSPGRATVSWPSPSTGFFLQTNGNLALSNNWAIYTGTIVTNGAGTTNSVTITPPVGNLFFRLGP